MQSDPPTGPHPPPSRVSSSDNGPARGLLMGVPSRGFDAARQTDLLGGRCARILVPDLSLRDPIGVAQPAGRQLRQHGVRDAPITDRRCLQNQLQSRNVFKIPHRSSALWPPPAANLSTRGRPSCAGPGAALHGLAHWSSDHGLSPGRVSHETPALVRIGSGADC